ncbi:MAG: flippase-like domain-containing protein, partial [Chitinophagaceae bacterium]|nr:flippase-like domain-containing protein [Chitinophagaceae bacterium]
MNEVQKNSPSAGRWLKLLLKIIVTAACLWYVSGKIDFAKAGTALKNANWFYLFLALIAFIISKLVAAIRLNIYFRNINIHLPASQNIKLYWLGMFYNLFLPGSIGGDAYKVILLTKKYKVPYKKTTAAVLLDRISGLSGLVLILAVYGSFVLKDDLYSALIITGAILSVVALYLILKFWLKDFTQSFFPALLMGVLVQASQVVCVYLIMAALNIPPDANEYIFIFLVSSIVAILPLTIGGLGAREIVFLEGSKYFGLLQETSVVISLLFYLIT